MNGVCHDFALAMKMVFPGTSGFRRVAFPRFKERKDLRNAHKIVFRFEVS